RAQVRQGKSGRKSVVYKRVNEHFEVIFNAASPSAAILRWALVITTCRVAWPTFVHQLVKILQPRYIAYELVEITRHCHARNGKAIVWIIAHLCSRQISRQGAERGAN